MKLGIFNYSNNFRPGYGSCRKEIFLMILLTYFNSDIQKNEKSRKKGKELLSVPV